MTEQQPADVYIGGTVIKSGLLKKLPILKSKPSNSQKFQLRTFILSTQTLTYCKGKAKIDNRKGWIRLIDIVSVTENIDVTSSTTNVTTNIASICLKFREPRDPTNERMLVVKANSEPEHRAWLAALINSVEEAKNLY